MHAFSLHRRGRRNRAQLAPGNLDRVFFEAAARGELLYQDCPACGHRQFYPRALCTASGCETAWATALGRGVVHTFTIGRRLRRSTHDPRSDR